MALGAATIYTYIYLAIIKTTTSTHSPQQHYDNHRVIPARPAQSVARLQMHIHTANDMLNHIRSCVLVL